MILEEAVYGNAKYIIRDAKTTDDRAINLYKKFGFEVEGLIRRSFFVNGTYYNAYHMGKIID